MRRIYRLEYAFVGSRKRFPGAVVFGVAAAVCAHTFDFEAATDTGDRVGEALDAVGRRVLDDASLRFLNHASRFADCRGKDRPAARHVHKHFRREEPAGKWPGLHKSQAEIGGRYDRGHFLAW